MSFGTNGAGSFNPSSLDSGAAGSPHSLSGFFTATDSGYTSKDSSAASQPQPIIRPQSDATGGSMAGSCEMGTSPAQRYTAERERVGSVKNGIAGSMGGGGSLGKDGVFGSLSPDMLASLDDTPFAVGMEMD